MAKFTKKAICDSFIKFLNSRQLDQITIKDIVEDCGVNRKTFYYYYQDIYALIDDFFMHELEETQKALPADVSWQDVQKALAAVMLKNKTIFTHVYHSLDYATLEQKAFEIGRKNLLQFIETQIGEADVKEMDVQIISKIYASAISGFFIGWVRDGMKDDVNIMIDRIAAVMDGTIELAIANAVKLKKK